MDSLEQGDLIMARFSMAGTSWGSYIRSRIGTLATAGMGDEEIVAQLLRDFSPGGAPFETIAAGFRNVTGEAVDVLAIQQVHDSLPDVERWMWVTVSDGNRCEDCIARDGEVATWDEWEARGLPGLGTTVCDWRCRCSLEPES